MSEGGLARRIAADATIGSWGQARTIKVARGFYISQALELVRP